MASREEFNRKELNEPDQFFETVGTVQRYIQENRNTVLAAVGTGVLVLILAVSGNAYIDGQRDAAAGMFARAVSNLEYESPTAARSVLDSLAERGLSGPYAALARLYKADLAVRSGEHAQAIEDYDRFLASAREDYLRQAALMGKAHALEMAESPQEATQAYAEAAATEGPYATQALENRARTAEAVGETAEAVKALERLLEVGGSSIDADDISRRIASLKGNGA